MTALYKTFHVHSDLFSLSVPLPLTSEENVKVGNIGAIWPRTKHSFYRFVAHIEKTARRPAYEVVGCREHGQGADNGLDAQVAPASSGETGKPQLQQLSPSNHLSISNYEHSNCKDRASTIASQHISVEPCPPIPKRCREGFWPPK